MLTQVSLRYDISICNQYATINISNLSILCPQMGV